MKRRMREFGAGVFSGLVLLVMAGVVQQYTARDWISLCRMKTLSEKSCQMIVKPSKYLH